MHGWFKVFLAIWLIFFSMHYSGAALIHPIFLIVIAFIVFAVAMMEVIKKK